MRFLDWFRPRGKSQAPLAPPTDPFHLDTPLFYVSPVDPWTIRDACEGVQIFGGIGSGKTSGSGRAIATSFLRAGFGGLVCCAKPEERRLWEGYARETGRESHLIVVSADGPWRFNFLDYELRRVGEGGGLTENLVALLTTITEIVEGKHEPGGGDQFWKRAMHELLRNAIDVLSIAQGTLTLEDICKLVMDAPQSRSQPYEESWQKDNFCWRILLEAEAKAITRRQRHDYEMAERYWLKNFAGLSDRTRTSIVATFTSVADLLLHGIAWELFCNETTLVPELTYKNGAIIVLDLPVQEFHELGRICQGIFKYMFQRAILRRDAEQDPRPVFLFCDESQNFISSYDYQYQAVARSARACTVYMTQNISNYYSVLGAQGKAQADALLGNFQTSIFHAQADHNTNTYAADKIAQAWTTSYSFNSGTGSANQPQGSMSAGGSDIVQYKVLPGTFIALKTGGPLNQLEVEAILFRNGRPWRATGENHIRTTFKQQ